MKKNYFLFFLLFYSTLYSQCNCAKNFGGWINDHTINIKNSIDSFYFSYFDAWPDSSTQIQGEQLFRYNYNCNLIWQKYIPHDVFNIDRFGNIYTLKLTGYYQNYISYLSKYDADGNLIWQKSIKGDIQGGNIQKYIFFFDDYVYVIGNFLFDLNIENKIIFHYPFQHFGGNHTKVFIAKYKTNGDLIDAREYGNGTTDLYKDAEEDKKGNFYLSHINTNFNENLIEKINSNLEVILSKKISSKTDNNSWTYIPTKLHYNYFNNKLYTYGVYYNKTIVSNTEIVDNSGQAQGLIAEFNPNSLILERHLKINNNSYNQIPNDDGNNKPFFLNRIHFAEENSDEMFAFGSFNNTISLGNSTIKSSQALDDNFNEDLILFKIDLNTFNPIFILKSSNSNSYSMSNAAREFFIKDNNVFLTANFEGKPIQINNITINNNSGNGNSDALLYKYNLNNLNIGNLLSNSPVCPNADIKLQASGGISYSWTGPNGFISTDQNPIIPNATKVNSGTYSCVITGSGDCDGIFTVEVKVEDKIFPIPDSTILPDIQGDCNTVVTVIPTATDNCSGKITATTTNPLQYSLPGTYTITWKYDDGNGNIVTQDQKIIITSPALPTASTSQTFCAISQPKISDIVINGQNIKWYDSSGNILNIYTPLVNGINYFATQTINGCESNNIKVSVTVNSTPSPTGNANQDFCTSRNAQIKDLVIAGNLLKFYDNSGNLLNSNTVLKNNTTYFVTQTLNNCESQKVAINVTLTPNSLPANDYNLAFCNDNTANTKSENLTKYQENIVTNSNSYLFEYFDQNNLPITDFKNRTLQIGQNIFNIKVKTTDGCWKMVKLILQLNPKPILNLPANAEYCKGLFVVLDAGSGFNTYLWNTGETSQKIKVNREGNYTVKVSNSSNCENTSSTIVKQSILAEIIKVEIFNSNAKVILSANGNFEFSLDNIHWQISNEFLNLNNGTYTVYVKTTAGCIIGQVNFTIFNIPNSFTPNGDGKNDTWKINGIENYPNSEITILDRFGTPVLHQFTSGTLEWNGTFNHRPLPTGTYWYIIKVSDGRVFQGNVLIKNRN